ETTCRRPGNRTSIARSASRHAPPPMPGSTRSRRTRPPFRRWPPRRRSPSPRRRRQPRRNRRPPPPSPRRRSADRDRMIAAGRRSTELGLVLLAGLITVGAYALVALGRTATLPANLLPFLVII